MHTITITLVDWLFLFCIIQILISVLIFAFICARRKATAYLARGESEKATLLLVSSLNQRYDHNYPSDYLIYRISVICNDLYICFFAWFEHTRNNLIFLILCRGLLNLYNMFLENCKGQICEVLQTFLEPQHYPIHLFCNLGKDRTGLITGKHPYAIHSHPQSSTVIHMSLTVINMSLTFHPSSIHCHPHAIHTLRLTTPSLITILPIHPSLCLFIFFICINVLILSTALVLSCVGAPRENICRDYSHSNEVDMSAKMNAAVGEAGVDKAFLSAPAEVCFFKIIWHFTL